jgi:hypothetical protein|nr:MAG TPA: hypothetical protein [Caudoviricetes sp.]
MALEISSYTEKTFDENPLIEIQKVIEDMIGRPHELRTFWNVKCKLYQIFIDYYRRHGDEAFRKLYTSIGCIEVDKIRKLDSTRDLLERRLYFQIDRHLFLLHV